MDNTPIRGFSLIPSTEGEWFKRTVGCVFALCAQMAMKFANSFKEEGHLEMKNMWLRG